MMNRSIDGELFAMKQNNIYSKPDKSRKTISFLYMNRTRSSRWYLESIVFSPAYYWIGVRLGGVWGLFFYKRFLAFTSMNRVQFNMVFLNFMELMNFDQELFLVAVAVVLCLASSIIRSNWSPPQKVGSSSKT